MRRRYEENKSKKNSENRWSSWILQLRWTLNLLLLVLLSFSLSSVFLFRPTPLLRPNSVLFIEHKVWPSFGGISEPFVLGKRRRSASGGLADRSALKLRSIGAYAFSGIVSRDRSACIPRSIGASSSWLCVVEPIDRLMIRDRSAMLLPFSLRFFKIRPIDRLMRRDRSAMPLPFWAR